jgi:hypothetical protein
MLSEKYIAGFLDADGSVQLSLPKKGMRPQMVLSFSQKTSKDEVLHLIQGAIGGDFKYDIIKNVSYSTLVLCGRKAIAALNRIKKYLVVKRHYANVCLDLADKRYGDRDATRRYLKEQRKVKSLPLPNYPSRKWLAGYVDGDGCLSVSRLTPLGSANMVMHIASSNFDTEGLEIIYKAFGGRIHDMANGRCRQYILALSPSKARQALSYFAKYLIVKKEQAIFILGCAAMGHYRDGKNIKASLKQLKAHDHRLSESGSIYKELLNTVRDLRPVWKKDGDIDKCTVCGTSERRHVGNGMCGMCYQRNRNARLIDHAIVETC